MADVKVTGLLDFSTVEVTFEALTLAARTKCFGNSVHSFTVRKTAASAVVERLEAAGLEVEVVR